MESNKCNSCGAENNPRNVFCYNCYSSFKVPLPPVKYRRFYWPKVIVALTLLFYGGSWLAGIAATSSTVFMRWPVFWINPLFLTIMAFWAAFLFFVVKTSYNLLNDQLTSYRGISIFMALLLLIAFGTIRSLMRGDLNPNEYLLPAPWFGLMGGLFFIYAFQNLDLYKIACIKIGNRICVYKMPGGAKEKGLLFCYDEQGNITAKSELVGRKMRGLYQEFDKNGCVIKELKVVNDQSEAIKKLPFFQRLKFKFR